MWFAKSSPIMEFISRYLDNKDSSFLKNSQPQDLEGTFDLP